MRPGTDKTVSSWQKKRRGAEVERVGERIDKVWGKQDWLAPRNTPTHKDRHTNI